MTIAIDARELRTTSGRYVERLLHYLQDVDSENKYLVLLKPSDFDGWNAKNPNFEKVLCPHKEFTFAEQVAFKRQLDSLKPDLVHFTFVQQPAFYNGLVVTTMQDLTTLRFRNRSKNAIVFWLKLQVYKWLNKRVARKSKLLITPTEYVRRDVANYTGVSTSKITATLESADAINDAPEIVPGVSEGRYLLYVGRPAENKNLSRLVEAFAILQKNHKDLQLVFAGKLNKSYHMLQNEVQARGVSGVVFTDFVSEGQLRWLYENCAVYVFPSLSEGFGLPGLEAMIHGAPVVSSNATCLPEVLGEAARYFNPYDTTAIARAIEDVLESNKLRNSLIHAGLAQTKKYSWRRMAEQTLGVYKKALK